MNNENVYAKCPFCGKKLFRVIEDSFYKNIYVWCKVCKKEINFTKREPKSHKV